MEQREKLIEALFASPISWFEGEADILADFLLANGVVVLPESAKKEEIL